MKRFVRDYLTFSKRERRGVFILLAIIVALIAYLNCSHLFIREETVDFTKFEKEITSLQSSASLQDNDPVKPSEKRGFSKAERFNFDPNNLPVQEWKRLGLSEKQIHTIKNYEAKGGKFRTKEDVKKMYCISRNLYLSLEPFIEIQEGKRPAHTVWMHSGGLTVNDKQLSVTATKPAANKQLIDLNSVDSTQLVMLKGIGAFYAKTIIKYRNSLGGFVSKEQLLEVWKLDQEKYDSIQDQIIVDNGKIKKININTCKATELKHPYLKWSQVNAIVNYRDKHGKYKTVEEIKKTDVLDDGTYLKIAPYLIIE
jgi:competence protein ComEA